MVPPLPLPLHTQRSRPELWSRKSAGQAPGFSFEPVGLLITINYQKTLGKVLTISGL